MKNLLQAIAIIAIGYAIYQSGWIEGIPSTPIAAEGREQTSYSEVSVDEPDTRLDRADEDAMLADFERGYTPLGGCAVDSRETRCIDHRQSRLNNFRLMWKNYNRR